MTVVVNNAVYAEGNGTSPSVALSVSGSDRCLFIGLKTIGGPTVSSPQVDGFTLTPIITDAGNDIYSYLYIAPATGSRTVQMTLDAASDWGLLVASLTGVHQSSPIGTAASAQNTEAVSISQSVTGVANGLVLDFASLVVDTISPGAGQTRYPASGSQGNSMNGGFRSIGMSAKSGTGSVTSSWSAAFTAGDNYLIVVPFLPSAGGGGASVTNQNLLLMGIG